MIPLLMTHILGIGLIAYPMFLLGNAIGKRGWQSYDVLLLFAAIAGASLILLADGVK